MKHAGADALIELEPLLVRLRSIGGLTERKPGTFYLRSRAFLHFHDDPAGLFADVRFDGATFERVALSGAPDYELFYLRVAAAVERHG